MTLEEAVAAYSLAYGSAIWIDKWSDGEKAFINGLLAQLKGQYYALNAGDILSCARDPAKIAEYKNMHKNSPAQLQIDKDFPDSRRHNLYQPIGPKHHAVIVSEFTLEGRKRNAD